MSEPLLQSLLMGLMPDTQRSSDVAVVYFASTVEQAIAGLLGGYALQHLGYGTTLRWLSLAVGLSALILILTIRPFRAQRLGQ